MDLIDEHSVWIAAATVGDPFKSALEAGKILRQEGLTPVYLANNNHIIVTSQERVERKLH